MARDFDRHVAKFQLHRAVLNGFPALGIPVTTVVEWVCPGEGEVLPSGRFVQQSHCHGRSNVADPWCGGLGWICRLAAGTV